MGKHFQASSGILLKGPVRSRSFHSVFLVRCSLSLSLSPLSSLLSLLSSLSSLSSWVPSRRLTPGGRFWLYFRAPVRDSSWQLLVAPGSSWQLLAVTGDRLLYF